MPDTNREVELQVQGSTTDYLLDSMSFTETIGQPYQMTLRVTLAKPDLDIYADLMGKPIVVRIKMMDSGKPARFIHGYVRSISEPAEKEGRRVFTLGVISAMGVMELTTDSRIFQDLTIKEIVDKVLDTYKIDKVWRLDADPPKRKICVQFRETDLRFVMRLLEQYGLSFYHEQAESKARLVITDAPQKQPKSKTYSEVSFFDSNGRANEDGIVRWRLMKSLATEKVTVSDFDFMKPDTSLQSMKNLAATHRLPKTDRFEYPGEYWQVAEGQALASVIAEELTSQTDVHAGEGPCRGLCAGMKFTLEDPASSLKADVAGKDYLITSVSIIAQNDQMTSGGDKPSTHVNTSFTAVPAAQNYRPPRITPKPVAIGPQSAIVVGPSGEEIHTDKYGRVRVHFIWDRQGKSNETDTCWLRVSQGMAGNQFGFFSLPRIGHEVLVEFIDGDPDRPIITGRVHNESQMPPYELPQMLTVSTFKTLSSKGGGGFHEIRFEDKKDAEMMFVHAQKDFDRRVKSDMKTLVGNNRSDTIMKDLKQKITGQVGQDIGEALSVKTGKDYSLDVGGKWKIKTGGNTSLKVDGDLNEDVKNFSVSASAGIMLKAATGLVLDCSAGVTLKCGGSSVVLDSSGVTIKGGVVTIDGSMVKIASGPGSPPGSGPACSVDSPAAPAAPEEPINADPGSMVAYQAANTQRAPIALDTLAGVPPSKPAEKKSEEEKTWLEVVVIDSDGEAVKSENVKVSFASGKVVSKKTDGSGKVRIDDVKESDGQANIELTDREDPEYDKVAEVESGDDTKPLADPEPEPGPVEPGEDVYTDVSEDVFDDDDEAPAGSP